MKRCSSCKYQKECPFKWEYGALYCNEYEEAEQVPAKRKGWKRGKRARCDDKRNDREGDASDKAGDDQEPGSRRTWN